MAHDARQFVTKVDNEINHRRLIKTEEKVKVVVTVWGTELIEFLATLAILHQDDLKKGMKSSFSSYCSGAIHPIF